MEPQKLSDSNAISAAKPVVTPTAPSVPVAAATPVETPVATPIVITGDPVNGGPFNIYGTGFGLSKGTLNVGGRDITLTKWRDTVVGGSLPAGVKGAIVLTTADGVRHGMFP